MATPKKSKSASPRAKPKAPAEDTGTPADRATRDKVQGEGDYASAREFNKDERSFAESHDTEDLAHRAAPEDAAKAAELEEAERAGKARAKPDPDSDDMDTSDADERDGGTDGNRP